MRAIDAVRTAATMRTVGARGPAPKPTILKKAAGNPGRRRLNEDEPVPPAGDITPPPELVGRALEVWNYLAPICVTMKTLTIADVLTFASYCQVRARVLELQKLLWTKGASGATYGAKTGKGNVSHIQNLPQLYELNRLQEIAMRAEDRFGLNPSARSRIKVQPSQAATPADPAAVEKDAALQDFFAGGGPAKPRVVS